MKIKKPVSSVFHLTGTIIKIASIIFLIPIIIAYFYKEYFYIKLFFITFLIMFLTGHFFENVFKESRLFYLQSLLVCAVSWIVISLFATIPFYYGIKNISFINSLFEAVSSTTTAGITTLQNLEQFPKTILFWRSIVQWFGGVGILTLFIIITFKSNGAYFQLFIAETSKIETSRPAPNIINTIYILGSLYVGLTILNIILLKIFGMNFFDALCHGLTNISTGGFSTHDSNILYFETMGYKNYKLIEYTIILFMFFGSTNFLILYKIFT